MPQSQDLTSQELADAAGEGALAPQPYNWQRHIGRAFEVDFTETGDDLIYQFWPVGLEEDFRGGRNPRGAPVFAYAIEEAFADLLPPDTEVVADLIDVEEQAAIAHIGGAERRIVRPHETGDLDPDRPLKPTLYVRVNGVLKRPMAYSVMTSTLFEKIDSLPALN